MRKNLDVRDDSTGGNDRSITKHKNPEFRLASDLLRSLITERKLAKSSRNMPSVEAAVRSLGEIATTGVAQERLEALSLLGKVAETSKTFGTLIEPIISAATHSQLPHTADWGTADDRYYLAKALSISSHKWVGEYAAVELAQGEVAEKLSRDVWARLAVSRGENLSHVIHAIADAISKDELKTHSPKETAFRKLNRTIIALSDPISDLDFPLGEAFGGALLKLISGIAGHAGPEIASLRTDTAVTFLDFVIRIARVRFIAGLDPDVYRAASIALGWWRPARPPEPITRLADRLARIALDCLHTLARQGVIQSRLRQALSSALGATLVNQVGTEIASKDPSLDHSTSAWLSTGKTPIQRTAGTAVQELNDRALDDLAGRLLLELDNQDGGPHSLKGAADFLEILEPAQAGVIRSAAQRLSLIEQWAHAIITKRRLTISGRRGETVAFDPALHEGESGITIRERARIVSPGVNKSLEGRQEVIILKPLIVRS